MLAVLVTASAQAPGEKQYQAGVCPRTADLEVSPSQKYWFEGEIGKKHVRMYLERGGDGVVGVFYDTMNWVPLILGGKWIAQQDAIEMIALTERDAENGLLKGQVTAGGITAIWSAETSRMGSPST